MNNTIYMDNAATTPIHPEVLEAMMPYLTDKYGNASSVHTLGHSSKLAVLNAKEQIADLINCHPDDIIFTSGATEANNWVVKSIREYSKSDHYRYSIASTPIEHDSIIESVDFLVKHKYKDVCIPVNSFGFVDPYEFEDILKRTPDIGLASVMWANNEIGTVQDIEILSEIANNELVVFHTDTTQALPHIPISFKNSFIDMMSASAHKIGGPKGVGMLVANKRIRCTLLPFMNGGNQENGLRAGTYNVAGIVGFGKAAEITKKKIKEEEDKRKVKRMKLDFIGKLKTFVDSECRINTPDFSALPNIISVSFKDVSGEELVTLLSQDDICCSAGSACNAGNKIPSHVLRAIEVPDKYINGTLRFSLGENNTYEEIDFVCQKLKEHLDMLRMK